ncbi:hypothetical protein [Aequorivita marisscotiae]|uniref:Uncharacterized protein n=1 Tax=Aequorivita marisscotiae TaxID=3040348 RepID=A0ABY8KUE9_9FLAO|nr:hypothetical protein [Aequorivita sp. Ant34-E75]WGF92771.1 hypothetical protein QCQ61_00945 [Aequorivita sp. Ant34-E75]
MKKKFVAISLLFVMFAPAVSMFLFLRYQKSSIKREIKWKMIAGIDEEELVLLKFSKEETQTKLRWKHAKEFEYNGQMYDIVSKEIKGDSIYYRCWWDHDETALNKKLQKLVADAFGSDTENKNNQKHLYHYLQSFFCTELLDWHAASFIVPAEIYQDIMHETTFVSASISPPTPPPKFG